MATKNCPCCHRKIDVKDRYKRGKHYNAGLNGPCETCKFNDTEEDEFPCRFCINVG